MNSIGNTQPGTKYQRVNKDNWHMKDVKEENTNVVKETDRETSLTYACKTSLRSGYQFVLTSTYLVINRGCKLAHAHPI